MRRFSLYILLTALLVGGCSEPLAPRGGIMRPGVLQLVAYEGTVLLGADNETVRWSVAPEDDVLVPSPVVVAPDTVGAGEPFDVTVTTIGPNGCWAVRGEGVQVGVGVVELIPTDVHSGAQACTEILLYLEHRSTLTLDEPGMWTLRVIGRRIRHGDAGWEEPVAVEKAIVVR